MSAGPAGSRTQRITWSCSMSNSTTWQIPFHCRNPEARHCKFSTLSTEVQLQAQTPSSFFREDQQHQEPAPSLLQHAAAFNARNSRCDAGAGGAGAAFAGACCGVQWHALATVSSPCYRCSQKSYATLSIDLPILVSSQFRLSHDKALGCRM